MKGCWNCCSNGCDCLMLIISHGQNLSCSLLKLSNYLRKDELQHQTSISLSGTVLDRLLWASVWQSLCFLPVKPPAVCLVWMSPQREVVWIQRIVSAAAPRTAAQSNSEWLNPAFNPLSAPHPHPLHSGSDRAPVTISLPHQYLLALRTVAAFKTTFW